MISVKLDKGKQSVTATNDTTGETITIPLGVINEVVDELLHAQWVGAQS